jgi:hypothetical protein
VTDGARPALAAIAKGRSADAVRAALEALPEGDPEVRAAILARWQRIAAAPRRLDADCSIRAALARGLRSCALPADRGLLEGAALTYEYSYSGEAATNLRAAAILTLARVDDQVATFHAVRLLRESAPGTGEPGLTAARLLETLGQPLPLYAHLLGGRAEGELAAACFHGLAAAPDRILLDLVERWSGSDDEPALLGLVDAVLDALPDPTPRNPHPRHRDSVGTPNRAEPEPLEAALLEILRESPHLDLVRYLATAVVARRRQALIEAMREGPWPAPARRLAVEEALALLG